MRSSLASIAMLCVVLTSAARLIAGPHESVIVVAKPPNVTILAVDGRPFKAGQQQITISPGHHSVQLRITDPRRPSTASLVRFEEKFEANQRYTVEAQLWGDGLKIHADKKPR